MVTPIAALTCILSIKLLSSHFVLTQIIWQFGLAATLAVAVRVFSLPVLAVFSMFLPMMAMVTLGWPLALMAEFLVGLLVLWLYRGLVTPAPTAAYAWIIPIGGVIAGTLAWAVIHALTTATQWSLYSYYTTRAHIEEARDQRLELAQIQVDLIQANNELARMAERLRTVSQIAEEARQAKEEFVANVSHELRTPLNMIIGFSEMITQTPQVYGTRLPPALLADITAIQRNSQHLSKLVNDVLDLSQVEAGRMTLSKDWASIYGIIAKAITAVTVLYDSKHLYLKTILADDLPTIFCDETRIRQVLLNLLSNAGRFTEQGGVYIKAWREQDKIIISVSDTGPGISPADQALLFEPFQQLDASIRRQHGGSGLGLSISKRFVEMHGGHIWVESVPGEGTTFSFDLPIETTVPLALAEQRKAQRWFSPYQTYMPRTRLWKAPSPQATPRYIVLEEGEVLQRLIARGREHVEVIGVHTLEAAVTALHQSPARALIVNAPTWETFGITKERLAILPYRTPTLLSWLPGEQTIAHEMGAKRYLTKPIAREELLTILSDLGEQVQTILLVDDDSEALQLFARMLASAPQNYDLLVAKGGSRALDLLRQRRPDVLLLDLVMPGVDGFQVLKEKQADPQLRDIPVVIMSSRDPTGQPIVSDMLTITRSGGISTQDLLLSIEILGEIFTPSAQVERQAPLESSAG